MQAGRTLPRRRIRVRIGPRGGRTERDAGLETTHRGEAVMKAVLVLTLCVPLGAKQPPIGKSEDEPTWPDLLAQQWGLHVDRDLRNPLRDDSAPAALFRRADPNKPVTFTPIIALGLETTTHGGWYPAGPGAADIPDDPETARRELWLYSYKQPVEQRRSGRYTPPQITGGKTAFDPGPNPFGFWVSNQAFDDGGVYTQPAMTARLNARLKAQPYKAMIYPYRDPKSGRLVSTSYLIGWEYSTNDDFQDVVTKVDNVRLIPSDPPLPGILSRDARLRRLAGGFEFTEGPAWSPRDEALFFSDIPRAHIVRFAAGGSAVANDHSGQSNGLMFDRAGLLVRCEHGGRRVSRGRPDQPGETIVSHYQGKRLNSPNDLWIDAAGGIYFTDPRYGARDDMEMDKEAVYYVSADGRITRIIDDLVRPNGIALAPDGRYLYVVDNGASAVHRYPVAAPGKIGTGQRIAHVTGPDGMTVDREGRLYIAAADGVWVLEADGKWIGCIETPETPANCTFGDAGRQTLYITARTSLYAIETQTRGWHVHLDGLPK